MASAARQGDPQRRQEPAPLFFSASVLRSDWTVTPAIFPLLGFQKPAEPVAGRVPTHLRRDSACALVMGAVPEFRGEFLWANQLSLSAHPPAAFLAFWLVRSGAHQALRCLVRIVDQCFNRAAQACRRTCWWRWCCSSPILALQCRKQEAYGLSTV